MKKFWQTILSSFSAFCLLLFISFPSFAAYSSGPTNPYSFSATQGNTSGSVILHWYDDGGAYKYNILYGTNPSAYSFGQINVPFTPYTANQDTISYLHPGTTYYFSLWGYMKDNGIPFHSGPIAITASNKTYQTTFTTPSANPSNPYSMSVSTGSQPGSVNIIWYDDGGAIKYDLLYGTSPTNLTFGVPNLGFVKNAQNQFTVNFLNSHQTYYFLLRGYIKTTGVPYLSGPLAAVAK